MRNGLVALVGLVWACSFDGSGLHGAKPGWESSAPRPEMSVPDRSADRLVTDRSSEGRDGPPAGGWKYRKKLTLAGVPSEPLVDFPLLVRIASDGELDKAKTTDVSFRTAQGAPLAFELELLAGADLTAWVKLPQIGPTGPGELYLYYGNTSAPSPPAGAAVWDKGYRGVWHFNELPPRDSGPASLVSNPQGGVKIEPGQIGKGVRFDKGPGSFVELGDGDLVASAPFSMELWLRAENDQFAWIGLLTKGRAGDQEWAGLWLDPIFQDLVFGWSSKVTGGSGNLSGAQSPSTKQWHQAVGTFDGTTMHLYLDGKLLAQKPNAYGKLTGYSVIGTDRSLLNPSLDGFIDEVRLSSVARSAAWVAYQHANQKDAASVVVGAQELVP